MTIGRRAPGIRRLSLLGALLVVAGGTSVAGPKPVELLRVASDEPIVLRFGRPVRASRLGSQTMRIVAEGTNAPARGQYVAGTFLKDRETGFAEVVDPDVYREAVQFALDLSRDDARKYVERALARHEATGGRSTLDTLRGMLVLSQMGREVAELTFPYYGGRLATLSQRDAAATHSWQMSRLFAAGDDSLWAAHMAGDETAFAKLAADPRFERFWHASDPLAGGGRRLQSDFRRREHRRVLFDRRPATRALTFVPDVPEASGFVGLDYEPSTRYSVTLPRLLAGPVALSAQRGGRLAVHRHAAVFETTGADVGGTDPDVEHRRYALSELDDARWRVTDVTPPSGETLVDPTTDWEDPDDRHRVPLAERRPFKIRFRFNKPLDPSTVRPNNVTLTMTRVGVGGDHDRGVNIVIPCGVLLRQSRLGAVELEVVPQAPLDPAAEYQVALRSSIRTLTGRFTSTDYYTGFTTAPSPEPEQSVVGFDDDFTDPTWGNWHEADAAKPRLLQRADVAHDPGGHGLFVPFVPGSDVPVAAIETAPIDSRVRAPLYRFAVDDPTTPEVDGTSIHAPPGSTVRVFVNSAPADLNSYGPNPYLWTGWVEVDPATADYLPVSYRQFFKLRVEFTLPPGATPDTLDLPSIDRLTLRTERP